MFSTKRTLKPWGTSFPVTCLIAALGLDTQSLWKVASLAARDSTLMIARLTSS